MKQAELGAEAEMKQGRISVLERIGEVSFSIETLIKLASAFRVGLVVKFVPMSEMLAWENSFMPDEFDVVPIEKDVAFIDPESVGGSLDHVSYSLTSVAYPSLPGLEQWPSTPVDYTGILVGSVSPLSIHPAAWGNQLTALGSNYVQ
jgi:hypothetical protein